MWLGLLLGTLGTYWAMGRLQMIATALQAMPAWGKRSLFWEAQKQGREQPSPDNIILQSVLCALPEDTFRQRTKLCLQLKPS